MVVSFDRIFINNNDDIFAPISGKMHHSPVKDWRFWVILLKWAVREEINVEQTLLRLGRLTTIFKGLGSKACRNSKSK